METGKPGLARSPVHISTVAAQTEKRMDTQAPMAGVYFQAVPTLPTQSHFLPIAAAQEPAIHHLPVPSLYSKETLPFLTLHIVGGLHLQTGLSVAAAAPTARPRLTGKHVCPHCGRDCMKPSVLEKHLRCHTGERPYPCTTCGVSFKTQSNLYKHKRTQAHARLSNESEQSSLGSLDSTSGSRETCNSSLSLEGYSKEPGNLEKDAIVHAEIICPATPKNHSVKLQGPVTDQNKFTSAGHKTESNKARDVRKEENKCEKPPLIISRRLPLKRQEATLFSKQWTSSICRGKSQSHDSTDSGFSESSDQNPDPISLVPDNSMDLLRESTKENPEKNSSTPASFEPGNVKQELKSTAWDQKQRTLEEHISKLISENTAVVEDKQLANVRPRKTVLSKQGSIDLPMPYTYKDSFHFDMRIHKALNDGFDREKNPGLYSSGPTPHSTTTEHISLTQTSSYQSDHVTLIQRGSSGQINPTGFKIKPTNQQSTTHHPLVRQTAVECNHTTEAPVMNSPVEEAFTSTFSLDGDGSDICGESSNRKFRRKKAQKFAYNKWYMYGGGTFKKLYNADKVDDSVVKGRKSSTNLEHVGDFHGLQKRLSSIYKGTTTCSTTNFTSSSVTVCPPVKQCGVDSNLQTGQHSSKCSSLRTSLQRNLSFSTLPLPSVGVNKKTNNNNSAELESLTDEEKHTDSHLCEAHIPSNRKKKRTDNKVMCSVDMDTLTLCTLSVTGCVPQKNQNLSLVKFQTNQHLTPNKGTLFPSCIVNANPRSVGTSSATSFASTAKTSFLPKYQLKLPNAAGVDSNPALHVVEKTTGTDNHSAAQHSPRKLAMDSSPVELPISVTSVVDTSIITTENSQTVAAAITASRQCQLPCLSHTQTTDLSNQSNLVKWLDKTDSSTPNVPCPIVSFESVPPIGQNVFHVHTADLQICLQIISDEQLALIESQIEQPAGSSLSQGHVIENLSSEVIRNKSHYSVTMNNEGRNPEQPTHQNEFDQSKTLSTISTENKNLSVSVHFGKRPINMTKNSDLTQATRADESNPAEAIGLLLQQHQHNQGNIATEIQTANVMSITDSLNDVKSGRSQTSEGKHAFLLKHCVAAREGQVLSDQHKLKMTFSPLKTVKQIRTSEFLVKERQHLGNSCNVGTTKHSVQESEYKCPPLQFGLSSVVSADELSWTNFSVNKSNILKHVSPHAAIYCRNHIECTASDDLGSSKHAKMEYDRMGPLDSSQDDFNLANSEEDHGHLTSLASSIQEERTKDIPTLPTNIQSPTSCTVDFLETKH